MTPSQLLAARIKRAEILGARREKAKISKKAFSKRTGLSRKTITNIETGKGAWSVDSEIIYEEGLK